MNHAYAVKTKNPQFTGDFLAPAYTRNEPFSDSAERNWSGRRHLNRRESAAFLRPYDTDPKLNTKRIYHIERSESMRPKNVITVFQQAGEFWRGSRPPSARRF